MKATLTAVALLALGASLGGAEPPPSTPGVLVPAVAPIDAGNECVSIDAIWVCSEERCTWMESREAAESATSEATAKGRPMEVVLVTAPARTAWEEWEFRDSVYDDWDYRDLSDY